MKNHSIPIDLLGPLITSKTRLKLLLRFFLNHNLSGYLQGLSKELDENTNSIRVELNRLEQAGILSSELEGRRKLYRVNELHDLPCSDGVRGLCHVRQQGYVREPHHQLKRAGVDEIPHQQHTS